MRYCNVLTALLLSAVVSVAQACPITATTYVDYNICLTEENEAVDKQLNEEYQSLIRELRTRRDTKAIAELRANQRRWLVNRDTTCGSQSKEEFNDGWQGPAYLGCVLQWTKDRTAELQKQTNGVRARPSVAAPTQQ
jgi:uncharacterized protein YecT (DUF1311 family)